MLGEFTLLFQCQNEPDREQIRLRFGQEGIGLTITQAPSAWSRRLRWPSGAPRWALVALDGLSTVEGEVIPDVETLLRKFTDAHIPTNLHRVESFLKANPDHLMSLAQIAGYFRMQAYAHWEHRRGSMTFVGREPSKPSEDERRCWKNYLKVLGQVLEHPLGTCPILLNRCSPFYFSVKAPQGLPKQWVASWEEDLPEEFGATDLARLVLPRLEADLARRPSDTALWDSWITFSDLLGKCPSELIPRLTPSPAASVGSWPPSNVLQMATDHLLRGERWLELVELLRPQWEADLANTRAKRKRPFTSPVANGNWNSGLARGLLEAYLHLGRIAEADRILNSSKTAILLGDLLLKAKQLGHEAWVQKWTPAN